MTLTFPYLENNVLRSVARVMEDNPLTHRFLLLPVVLAGFGFLTVKFEEKTKSLTKNNLNGSRSKIL